MKKCDIAILGGGIAGLVAAYELRNRDIILLEAEEKLGGRIVSGHLRSGEYYNLGANYLSDDKVAMFELVDKIGVEMIPHELGLDLDPVEIFKNWAAPYTITLDDRDIKEFTKIWDRIKQAKDNPRALSEEDLDRKTAQEWLGNLRPNVYLFVNMFSYLMCNSDISELSVIGFLWAWGQQRTSPWSDEKYWKSSGRGDCIVKDGTGRIADKLGEILGAKAKTSAKVINVKSSTKNSIVTCEKDNEIQQFECKQIVSALPAPVVFDVFPDLPDWKRAALSSVRYGKYIITPIIVSAPDVTCKPFQMRPFRREIGTNWIYGRPYQMSPASLDKNGGFFTCITTDADARRIWEDNDDSIKSGVIHVFTTLYPQLANRILYVGLKRWEHGLPQLRLGYMNLISDLQKAVGNVVFCGDYTQPLASTDSANRSALRALNELRSM